MGYYKKSLGQNFLIDLNIIKKIINITKIKNKDILEIGPGNGSLTDEIIKANPKSLTLIEKDNSLSKKLKTKYLDNKKIKIYNKDILKFDLEKKIKKNTIIIGNLPYNISSQILIKMIKFNKWPPKYSTLILMFQKEMANRILGNYNTPNYGRLSIITSSRLNIKKRFDVSANCFFPKPKVISTVLSFEPKTKILHNFKNVESLEYITSFFFSNRRKMINKKVNSMFGKIKKSSLINDLDLKARPSDLKPEKYYQLTELFEKIN